MGQHYSIENILNILASVIVFCEACESGNVRLAVVPGWLIEYRTLKSY